ncbi:MAG: hypothetical protein ACKV1O_10325 [Saprospiraceae bacterium]
MTTEEREQLQRDYSLYLVLLDYYAKNREGIKSMTDEEYRMHIDEILDEINRLRKLLEEDEN